jgi:hypothetical protein
LSRAKFKKTDTGGAISFRTRLFPAMLFKEIKWSDEID